MIRTRFAPSPTGYMHIGNLRTALYSYLIAKHDNGQFVLRIEDTDQKRSQEFYTNYIFNTLKDFNLNYDEGPDKDGSCGPYIQSKRKEIYLKYAKQLVEKGFAYYCFCPDCHSDLERYKPEVNYGNKEENRDFVGYNGHCRNLTKEQVAQNLHDGKPFVIRQKLPENTEIKYHDEIYGDLTFNTIELDDQVLIKQDGYPTYNFANVVDDHLMKITHVVRGNEYLSSTPKYVLLYQAFGWDVPKFIHLPLIYIKDSYGFEQKLSKRFNCSSTEDLINLGYLPDAILNYIVTLGWGSSSNQEIYSLKELEKVFNIGNINKSTKVLFDNDKLDWFNHQYILKLSDSDFIDVCKKYCDYDIDWEKVTGLIKTKVKRFGELNYELSILNEPDVYPKKLLFDYKKKDYDEKSIKEFIEYLMVHTQYNNLSIDYENMIRDYSKISNISVGSLMYIYRIIICGRQVVIMSATDVSELIGKNNVIDRLKNFYNTIL